MARTGQQRLARRLGPADAVVVAGCAVLAAGAVVYGLRRTLAPRSP
ncbi:hypothetical protein ABZ470_16910 [Streptosporangium sp. NPDC020072]|uniref:Uncharacterized protein n=1 Tax=Streptosporangium jomthongense TaxID=1193683 RepID=A0ABV8FC81_9ACTN